MGTLVSAGAGLALGGITGYTMDTFKDLAGIEESKRLPAPIKKQSSKIKKGLIALVTAASIGAVAGVYSINDYLHYNPNNSSSPVVSSSSR